MMQILVTVAMLPRSARTTQFVFDSFAVMPTRIRLIQFALATPIVAMIQGTLRDKNIFIVLLQ